MAGVVAAGAVAAGVVAVGWVPWAFGADAAVVAGAAPAGVVAVPLVCAAVVAGAAVVVGFCAVVVVVAGAAGFCAVAVVVAGAAVVAGFCAEAGVVVVGFVTPRWRLGFAGVVGAVVGWLCLTNCDRWGIAVLWVRVAGRLVRVLVVRVVVRLVVRVVRRMPDITNSHFLRLVLNWMGGGPTQIHVHRGQDCWSPCVRRQRFY